MKLKLKNIPILDVINLSTVCALICTSIYCLTTDRIVSSGLCIGITPIILDSIQFEKITNWLHADNIDSDSDIDNDLEGDTSIFERCSKSDTESTHSYDSTFPNDFDLRHIVNNVSKLPCPDFSDYTSVVDHVEYFSKKLKNVGYLKAVEEISKIDPRVHFSIINKDVPIVDITDKIIVPVYVHDKIWETEPTNNTMITKVEKTFGEWILF